jgi:hypothetical protein
LPLMTSERVEGDIPKCNDIERKEYMGFVDFLSSSSAAKYLE